MDPTVSTGPVDRSTNAPSILAVNGVFCGAAVLVMAARFYVRAVMLKTLGTDDWLILAATLCGVGVFTCFVGETHNGKGMHMKSIRPDESIRLSHWTYFHSIIVTVGISLVKLSVAFFLLRLAPGKAHKIFLYCVIAFLCAFTLSSAGTIAFSCIPIRASWDRASEPNAKCFSLDTFTNIGLFNSSKHIQLSACKGMGTDCHSCQYHYRRVVRVSSDSNRVETAGQFADKDLAHRHSLSGILRMRLLYRQNYDPGQGVQ